MLQSLKMMLRSVGQGLLHQELGEMMPTEEKIKQIERRRKHYRLAGGQGSLVLIVSSDPLGPAFDFVVEMADRSGDKIEVLYIQPAEEARAGLELLVQRLTGLERNFQLTYHNGDLYEKLLDYGLQRQDVTAVVCSASEVMAEKLKAVPSSLDSAQRNAFPSVLLVGNTLTA